MNRYINYPFLPNSCDPLSSYIEDAADLNIRVKIYYTIRELTTHAVELFALRSLNGEVFPAGDPVAEGNVGDAYVRAKRGGGAGGGTDTFA